MAFFEKAHAEMNVAFDWEIQLNFVMPRNRCKPMEGTKSQEKYFLMLDTDNIFSYSIL